jgi:hypothetical protein
MRCWTYLIAAFTTLFLAGGVSGYRKPFREYPAIGYDDFLKPTDRQAESECCRCDDFPGPRERSIFVERRSRVFPDHPVVDLEHKRSPSSQHADKPQYPEKYPALGFRIDVNYIIDAMTH